MRGIKVFTTAALVAFGTPLVSQAATSGEIELSRASIQVQRKAIVAMNMALDEPTAQVFWPLYNDYVEAMRKPNDRATALLTEYAANWTDLSEEKAKTLLNDLLSVKQEQLNVKKSFAKKFSRKLPPRVVARFFQIENKLDAIIANELALNVPLVH